MSIFKEYNANRHYETKHTGGFDSFIGKARRDQMAELQKDLNIQQSMFDRDKNESEDPVIAASFLVRELIARNSTSFYYGAFVNECMLKAAETVSPDKRVPFSNVSFSRNTVVQRVVDLAGDLTNQLEEKVRCFLA